MYHSKIWPGCQVESIKQWYGIHILYFVMLYEGTKVIESLDKLLILEKLDLSHNEISNVSALSSLVNLRYLNLNYNNM